MVGYFVGLAVSLHAFVATSFLQKCYCTGSVHLTVARGSRKTESQASSMASSSQCVMPGPHPGARLQPVHGERDRHTVLELHNSMARGDDVVTL